MSQRVIEEQKRCIVSWCRNWNDEQREQFAASLEQSITGRADVAQLVCALSLEEASSPFEYQVRLFRRWSAAWVLADLLDLLSSLRRRQ